MHCSPYFRCASVPADITDMRRTPYCPKDCHETRFERQAGAEHGVGHQFVWRNGSVSLPTLADDKGEINVKVYRMQQVLTLET